MNAKRTNERLNPSGARLAFEISRRAVGPMAAETRGEAAVTSKRNDKRWFIVKSGVGRMKGWVVEGRTVRPETRSMRHFICVTGG